MTVKQLITHIRATKINAFQDEALLLWINELEADIALNVLLLNVEDVVEHKTENEELLADAAHSSIYRLYLMAMIDLGNGEYSKYQNNYGLFERAYSDYKIWYADRYNPVSGRMEVQGYYLSAYALAVKHGFQGSEAEWIAAVEQSRTEAEGFAQAAGVSAQAAQDARQGAETAAQEAQGHLATVEASVQAAAGSASAAETARAAAQTAREGADAAQAAAEDAQGFAESVREAAEQAAGQAGDSAQQAAGSAGAAGTAQAAAEAAAQAALSAKLAAEAAQGLAETARAAAQAAESGALDAKSAAETAATAANQAQGLAQTAREAAEGAAMAAINARNAAQAAALSSAESADEAEAWATGTIGGAPISSGHPAYQNNAKWYKDQASAIVGGDYPTKTEAQGYANTAEANAKSYADTAKAAAISTAAADATNKASTALGSAMGYTDQQIAGIPPVDISGKLDKTGDGKDVTVTFTQAASLANVASGEKLSVLLGKIRKWFADLGTAAFKAEGDFATAAHTHGGITNDGKVGTAADKALYTGTGGTVQAGTLPLSAGGTGATTAAAARTSLGAATAYNGEVTLTAANWAGTAAPYSYTISVAGILATDYGEMGVVHTTDEAANKVLDEAWAAAQVRVFSSAGAINLRARGTKPTVNIPVFYWGCR